MASVPFDQLDGFIWMNGEFVKWADAKVHVLTHGLHYASAVFEGERAYGGEIFKLTEHTERLHESARILGFKIPYSVAEIDDACRDAARRSRVSPTPMCVRSPGAAASRWASRRRTTASTAPSPSGSGRAISIRRRS